MLINNKIPKGYSILLLAVNVPHTGFVLIAQKGKEIINEEKDFLFIAGSKT